MISGSVIYTIAENLGIVDKDNTSLVTFHKNWVFLRICTWN